MNQYDDALGPTLSIRVSHRTKRELEAIAKAERVTPGDIIRPFLDAYLDGVPYGAMPGAFVPARALREKLDQIGLLDTIPDIRSHNFSEMIQNSGDFFGIATGFIDVFLRLHRHNEAIFDRLTSNKETCIAINCYPRVENKRSVWSLPPEVLRYLDSLTYDIRSFSLKRIFSWNDSLGSALEKRGSIDLAENFMIRANQYPVGLQIWTPKIAVIALPWTVTGLVIDPESVAGRAVRERFMSFKYADYGPPPNE